MIWFLIWALQSVPSHGALTKIASCEPREGAKYVRIIKQWHLPPTTITKGFKEKYPQETNQTDIYKQLNELVKKKKLQVLMAEGCEGEINQEFKLKFNGWDYASLKKISQTKTFSRILTHVPLKLAARHGAKLRTLCGDNEKLIQEGNLRISNLRGWLGFWSRLTENNTDHDRLKMYAEAAADLLKLPRTTKVEKLLAIIKSNMKSDLDAFLKSLRERNEGFVKLAKDTDFTAAAIVIGGLHAEDLRTKLQDAKFNCDVFEPAGYQPADEKLIQDFEKAL